MSAVLVLGLLFGSAEPSQVRCVITASEVLSLVYTLESALGEPHITPVLKETIEKDPAALAAIADAKSALAAGPKSIRFYENSALSRGAGNNLLGLIELAAVQANDVADLGVRTRGLLPTAEHARLMSALLVLERIHREGIWKPGAARLFATQRELEALWKKANGDQLVSQMAGFYRSEWPAQTPFTIALVPVAHPYKGKLATYAHSIDALEVVEVFESPDLANVFGVMIHEIAHSMSDAAPIEAQRERDRWFESGSALAAGQALEEALATAIGNGHATFLVKGSFRDRWYNDPIIDGFAHDLYASIKDALENGRAIDLAFATTAISAFDKRFPNAGDAPKQVFRAVTLIVAAELQLNTFAETLKTHVRVGSMQRSSPLDHPKTIESYTRTSPQPALFVVRRADREKLSGYAFAAALKALLDRAAAIKQPSYLATKSSDARLKVFVFVESTEEGKTAIERLAELDTLTFDDPKPL